MNSEQDELLSNIDRFVTSLPRSVLIRNFQEPNYDVFDDFIIPFELYRGTRQYIERVADQINKCYAFGTYDGCAVLMRRIIEMLLVLTYKKKDIEEEIKGSDGNYLHLSQIIVNAKNNKLLDLSRNAKEYLDIFRVKGNLSAHNLFHNTRKKDLELFQPKFRHLIEELFYKAGIIK